MSHFDYIIVGAGSAGCVLANRLSANPDIRVCLLEAGGSNRSPLLHVPAGWAATFGNSKFDWGFQTEPEPELTPEEMRAAQTLGFDAEYWDNGMTPDAIALPWSALPPPLRAAAMVLDYTARDWNEDGGFDE